MLHLSKGWTGAAVWSEAGLVLSSQTRLGLSSPSHWLPGLRQHCEVLTPHPDSVHLPWKWQ